MVLGSMEILLSSQRVSTQERETNATRTRQPTHYYNTPWNRIETANYHRQESFFSDYQLSQTVAYPLDQVSMTIDLPTRASSFMAISHRMIN